MFDKESKAGNVVAERYDKQGLPISVGEWERVTQELEYKQIGYTEIGAIHVRTTWLGLDPNFASFSKRAKGPNPLIFETLISAPGYNELDGEKWLYETLEEAMAGHQAVVVLVRNLAGKVEESLPDRNKVGTLSGSNHRKA